MKMRTVESANPLPERVQLLGCHPAYIKAVRRIRSKFEIPLSGFADVGVSPFSWDEFMCGSLSDEVCYSAEEIRNFKQEIKELLGFFNLPRTVLKNIASQILFDEFKTDGLWEKASTVFEKDETGRRICTLKIREPLKKEEYARLMNGVNFFLGTTKKGSDKPYRSLTRDIDWYMRVHGLNGRTPQSREYLAAEICGYNFDKTIQDEIKLQDVIRQGVKSVAEALRKSFPPETFDAP